MKKLIIIFAILFLTVPAIAKVGLYGNPVPIVISSTRNDPVLIKLYDLDNTVYTEAEVQAITKIEIKYTPSSTADSESTDSVACSDCFNVTDFSSWGEIWVDIANVAFTVGRDREAELIIYTADYTLGHVIATLDIKIDDGAIRDATMIEPLVTVISLDDISDVSATGAVIGQFLQKTGTTTYAFATASGGGSVEDTAYESGWNGDTTNAPSQNAVYDKIETLAGGQDPVTIDTANGLSLATQALSLAPATNLTPGAATAAHIAKIEANEAKVTDDDIGVAEAYDDTGWNGDTGSPQKNDVRDKINTMDTAIGLNTAKVTEQDTGSNTGDEPDGSTTVKGIVELATDGESAASVVVQGNDSRLSDTRTPTDNSVTGAKIALGSDAAGDIMYYNGTDWVRLAKGTAAQVLAMNAGVTAPEWVAASGGVSDEYLRGTIAVPNSLYPTDTEWAIWAEIDGAITISRIFITCDADPTTELDVDLMWADALIGLANATVIDVCDTTNGTVDISSGFDDETVASGKVIYWRFGDLPDAGITQMAYVIEYTHD